MGRKVQDRPPYQLVDLLRVMDRLRDPEKGCPWDLAQDFDTIVPSTLEECYELVEAIEDGDFPHLAEELGDLLFQVVFYARLGQEQGLFDFLQVVDTLVEKLVRRHPHVFAAGEIEGVVNGESSVIEVGQSWEQIKRQERSAREQHSALADIPRALPALSRAQKVQKRAANVGFDWSEIEAVLDKVREELDEYQQARQETRHRQEEELGDLLFSCVNLARHAGVDAEAALRRATAKFERRFHCMEQNLQARGDAMIDLDEAALDIAWEAAKRTLESVTTGSGD